MNDHSSVNSEIEPQFAPNRSASWWVDINDLLWPERQIVDRIRRRAAAFAEADIAVAINFGFHIRFDYANYFGRLHGYYANVCEELHSYGIRFMDHYSCNHVERPRGDAELEALHSRHRHHVLLYHDHVAAEHAQYDGHFFNDICEVDLIDGGRGYARQYQLEAFCHNNPEFRDMHTAYLNKLLREVPLDGIQVDDMCDYPGLTTCGCRFCRERLQRDYGSEIPPFPDKSFWGDTTGPMLSWGNYDNPAFRDWIRMKADSVADHVKLIRSVVTPLPLMTCCSASGPIRLNSISLNLQRMAPYLDIIMLENVGINVTCTNWTEMDAEAIQQKDIAIQRGIPSVACSYTIYEEGAYLGWCLSRFWGVENWSSTLNQRLERDPPDAAEISELIGPYYNWETKYSPLAPFEGQELQSLRIVSSEYCRDNGWRDGEGIEQWGRVVAWSKAAVSESIGYRILRDAELSSFGALDSENTPLVLDSVACVSDAQAAAVSRYIAAAGVVWLRLPYGTHDENGYRRSIPLSDELLRMESTSLSMMGTADVSEFIASSIRSGSFRPAARIVDGCRGWSARIRLHNGRPVIHFLCTSLVGIPHPTIKDSSGTPILTGIERETAEDTVTLLCRKDCISFPAMVIRSPELGEEYRDVRVRDVDEDHLAVSADLSGIRIYAVAQSENSGNSA